MNAPSPGIAQTPHSEPTKPHIAPDIDPVLLVRLYGAHAGGGLDALKGEAMKAGEACYEAGKTLKAAQQEPVTGQEGQPPAQHPAPPATHTTHG